MSSDQSIGIYSQARQPPSSEQGKRLPKSVYLYFYFLHFTNTRLDLAGPVLSDDGGQPTVPGQEAAVRHDVARPRYKRRCHPPKAISSGKLKPAGC